MREFLKWRRYDCQALVGDRVVLDADTCEKLQAKYQIVLALI